MYNALGQQKKCEEAYYNYVKRVEMYYGVNSAETSNCYFMLGIYYFENLFLDKALLCYQKCIWIRKSLNADEGIADCKYNVAVIYWKKNQLERAITELNECLEIRWQVIGPDSIPASKCLEL